MRVHQYEGQLGDTVASVARLQCEASFDADNDVVLGNCFGFESVISIEISNAFLLASVEKVDLL